MASSRSHPTYLTCAELVDTAIEVRNGTPAPRLAREVRSRLEQDAFTVTKIGNHVDFGAAKTTIYYRPVALRVAQALQTDIFPMASLEPSDQLRGTVAIKVLLGHDLLENQDLMARLHGNEAQPRATVATPPAAANSLAAPHPAPAAQAPLPAGPSKPLTAAELADAAIEIRNGTHAHNLAHLTRTRLDQEGFSVAKIGNHIDFGAAQTIIYFRPEGQRVARALGHTLFPQAALEPCTQLHKNIAVKILLGADLLERPQVMAHLAIEGK
jgi:LytR cell envelope-related transcriptional attenuator